MLEKIDHIGIAVKDADTMLRLYQKALGMEVVTREVVAEQGVEAVCLAAGESEIELLQPINDDGPVAKFIKKRGEGIHHIAFGVEDLEKAIERVEAEGFALIDATPRLGVGGSRMVFLQPKTTGGVLLELYERKQGSH